MATESGDTAATTQRGIRVLEICAYPPPRAGWSMRVEVLKRELDAGGNSCVVLNVGQNRRVPSPHYETVMNGWDYASKVWKFAREGYTIHAHVNGESVKGLLLALFAELAAAVSGGDCVLTFHAGIDQRFFPRDRALHLFPAFRLLFWLPRAIICNTEGVRCKIAEYGVPLERIHAIPAFTRQYLSFGSVVLPGAAEEFIRGTPAVLFTYIRIREGFYLDTLIDGFARVATAKSGVGLLVVGVAEDINPELWVAFQAAIKRHRLESRICILSDLDHDAFLTALTRSALYLRTPTTDGAASSVLEALALRIPVVGAENGTRPLGVITYAADDAADLARKVTDVLDRRDEIARNLPPVEIRDTIVDEMRVLASAASP